MLFPYTPRFIEILLADTAKSAGGAEKSNRWHFARYVCCPEFEKGEGIENVLRKIGLSETTWEDAKEKYQKLAMRGI